MPTRGSNVAKLVAGQKSKTSDENPAKFRNKILGLSFVAEQNSASPSFGNPVDQKDLVAHLNEELVRRQESYVRREREYKARIDELEALLANSRAKKCEESALDVSMDRVRTMHRNILDSVEQVQDRTSKILQEQEKDLLRAFRARLYSVQEELESEKNRTDDGASAWIEKSKQLETEVEWTKELADRLDRLNQNLTRENQRLKTQFSTQENDREFLVKQLVTVKKDNASLRAEVDALQLQLDQLRELGQPQQPLLATASTNSLPKVHSQESASTGRPKSAGVNNTLALASGGDSRYKEIIKRLKRLLEAERQNLQQVRTAYKLELQNHTELEVILRDCVQDIRNEIARVSQLPIVGNSSSSVGSSQHAGQQSESRFTASERQQLIEMLSKKEQLLSLLTTRTLASRNGKRVAHPSLKGEAVLPNEVAKLLTNVSNPNDVKQ